MDIAVEEDKLSQAIGRGGQNIRLASELSGWELNVMTAQDAEEKSETAAAVSERTKVRVVNDNWHDITVYAVRGGYRRRLGLVNSFAKREFTLPPAFLIPSDELRLIADPIGRRGAFVSEPLVVNPGDVVEWRLLNNLRLSNIFIYRFRVDDL